MTQAIARSAPAAYGSAFAQIYATARHVSADQREELARTWELANTDAYRTASKRLDEALDLLGIERETFESPALITDTVYAVLAFDRGLLSRADFEAITGAWTLAGLPLPMQIDGDEEIPTSVNINFVTADALADELLHAANGTADYAAVLMLTGYNHGELLNYPSVRACIDRRPSTGEFVIDWALLRAAVDDEDDTDDGIVDEVEENVADILAVTLSLLPGDEESLVDFIGRPNAAAFVTAAAYGMGVEHLLFAGGVNHTQQPAVVPRPREWEPSA
jgi:hypothetical protein